MTLEDAKRIFGIETLTKDIDIKNDNAKIKM